jgi:hypothetical protein
MLPLAIQNDRTCLLFSRQQNLTEPHLHFIIELTPTKVGIVPIPFWRHYQGLQFVFFNIDSFAVNLFFILIWAQESIHFEHELVLHLFHKVGRPLLFKNFRVDQVQ